MQLEQREHESKLEWHKRLIDGKLSDKTLADVDYSELSEYVYGQPYSSDVARRMMYGSKKTLDLMESEGRDRVSGTEMADELDMRLAELKREQQKFYDQRREYSKLLSADGRAEHLYDVIRSSAERLSEDIGIMYPVDTGHRHESDNDAVIVFSDWHYGLKASNSFNEFNVDICKERIASTVRKMIERIEFHHCRTAHIVILGDLFHGAIHVSARVASEEVVCEQIMHVSEILAQSIYEISKHVAHVEVHLTYGNHARTVQNKKDNIHSDNMERLVLWWLAERFKDNESIAIVPESENIGEFILMNVRGHMFCATHGDLDSVSASPKLLTTLFSKKYGIDIEYILLGDKHHRESFNELGVTALLCGSLCGTDDYANEKRLYADPSQILLIVNEECGVDAEYRIKG